jgi:hypothetical protein
MIVQPVILTTPGHEPFLLIQQVRDQIGPAVMFCDRDGLGAARATKEAIRLALEVSSNRYNNPRHILFLEDDVEMHWTAPAYVFGADFPEHVGVMSFCDMREMPSGAKPGIYPCSALGSDQRGWWGNQAIAIRRDVAEYLAIADWFSESIENSRGVRAHKAAYEDEGRNCSDIRMSLLVHTALLNYAVHVPSVFLHVGHQSRCFPNRISLGERETRNWAGVER